MVPYVKGEGPESRNTTSLGVVPQAETQQLLSPTHTSTVHWVFSVFTIPLTNSGSVSPPNTFSRHQATTHTVQGGVGLPRAQQPHQHWLTCRQSFKSLDTFFKKYLEKSSILLKPQSYPKIWFGEFPAPQPFARTISAREIKQAE